MQHSQNASDPQATREVVRNLGHRKELSLYGSQIYDSLEAVDIPSLPVDLSSPLLSGNLVSLTLHRRGRDRRSMLVTPLDLTILIEVLRRMPLLEVFAMDNVLKEPSKDPLAADLTPAMPLQLLHLETFRFHSSCVNYRRFMRKLDYTPSLLKIDMKVKCTAVEVGAEQSNGLQLIPFNIASSVGEIEVANDTSAFRVSGWRREAGQRSPRATFSATMTLEGSSGFTQSQGVFAFVSEHRHSLLSVEHLQFSWIKPSHLLIVSRDWAPLLRMLPGLESITADYMASGWDCIGIAEALAATGTTVSGDTELTCPKLRRLKFRSVVFEPGLVEFVKTLASTLELRYRYNMRCEELCIGGSDQKIPCNGPDDFQALRIKVKEDFIHIPVQSQRCLSISSSDRLF